MPSADGKLKVGEKPMTDEKWEENKSCALSKRAHKFYWESPSSNNAICAHCGFKTVLTRRDGDRD
jgi:hypothetical protein